MQSVSIRESDQEMLEFSEVRRYNNVDEHIFKIIREEGKPAILQNCYFGECMFKWDLEYLNDKLKGKQVVIHESSNSNLDFLEKNFHYKTCSFEQFVRELRDREKNVYLRSTNDNPRKKKPAMIGEDFPMLSSDLQPPSFVPHDKNKLYHSSVLRIASLGVQVWTHFDLYDNVLCQVVGTKRVILLPPEDTKNLYIIGDKSPVNNFDDLEDCVKQYPLIENSKPYRCLLEPGEVLFIPSLWWHNIKTIEETIREPKCCSIGFNIFWKDELLYDKSQYASTDVYGNKNLPAFDSATMNLDRALGHLDKLPEKYKKFYQLLLIEKLKSKISAEEPE